MEHKKKIALVERFLDRAAVTARNAASDYRKGNLGLARTQMLESRDNVEKALRIEEQPSE